jgi:hypothetical protein
VLDLRPIRVKFGVLKSDFRDGLAKFFNNKPVECMHMLFQKVTALVMVAIIKDPKSYTIRERITREIDVYIRDRIPRFSRLPQRAEEDTDPRIRFQRLLAVKLIWILTKYNPKFLCHPQHDDIL